MLENAASVPSPRPPGHRGRGAAINPGNRFESISLHVLGEHIDRELEENGGELPRPATTILDDRTRSILNRVDSPDLSMEWTVNPYRGCEHGCIYCYARPGHEYLGMSCGIDFETRIMAKRDAAPLLREALSKPSWKAESIMMSGVTDPYQPIERELEITRSCVKVCAEFRQPLGMISKNKLMTRDIDLFREMARWNGIGVTISLTTLDPKLAMRMEPRASSPRDRLEAIRKLADAGIPVSVMTAPIVPGINDREIPALLEAAAKAGAQTAGYTMMRLPFQVKELFVEWLNRHFPERASHVLALVMDVREGKLNDPRFGTRMKGTGAFAEQVRSTFKLFAKRHGFDRERPALNSRAFRRPPNADGPGQLDLFGK
jgi:DNA repair photolyase